MYRETIEHPASIPEPIKKHLDLTSGKDRGRLYNLVPDGFQKRPRPALGGAKTAELVALLADPDAWWRETAQRLLLERKDPAALPLLKDLVRKRPNALGRMHALWTLESLGGLEDGEIIAGLNDPEPGVREQAVRLAEGRTQKSPDLLRAVLALAKDPDPMVRFQAAFSLGEVADPGAIAALAEIAARDATDPWTRTAVLSSVAGRSLALFDALAGSPGFLARPEAATGSSSSPSWSVPRTDPRPSGSSWPGSPAPGSTRRRRGPSCSAWDAACNARGDRSATRCRAPTPRNWRPCSRVRPPSHPADGPAGPGSTPSGS